MQAGAMTVFGARGKTGTAVIRALRRRGAFVRAVVREPVSPGSDAVGGADEVTVADLNDADATAAAVERAGGVYLMAPNMFHDEPGALNTLVQACDRQQIPRVVYHSVLHPYAPAMPHHLDKARVESFLHDSNLDWTILQPASYFENALGSWDSVRAGSWPLPYPSTVRFTPVALADVADVAARVLTELGHTRATYELAGPQDLSTDEMADQAAAVLGRPVAVTQTDPGPDTPPRLRAMFDYYAGHGFRGNPRTLALLLGRPPISWRQWLQQLPPPS